MISIFKSLGKPVGAVILMLSIVLIPVFSGLSIQADAAEIYQAYTKSGEYPASDHLKNPIYVRPQGSNDKGDVAYCFNDHRAFPESSSSPRKTLYTKELGTAANFTELADTERVTGENLYNALIRVIYDGYPSNNSGIKERYGLTDGQFRQITQYAVWYYTDTFNMPNRDTSGNNFTQNEKDAFNDLVNSTTAIPAGTQLDIYRSQDNAYQNLLSGHFQAAPTPQPTTKEVEFSKVKAGGTELAGAQIQIFKGTQKVGEWTSTTTSKKIMLEPGQYRFHEEAAPAGFLAVTDFTFTVNADGTVTLGTIAQGETVVAANGKITVTDNARPAPTPTSKQIEFSKVKLGGAELAGAQIQIFNGTQKIEEWVSGTTSHMVMLEPGQYRFHEEAAPEGYLVVTDFTFTVNADGTVTLGTIAQGETVVAANGKITVTDNARPVPTPTSKQIEFSKVKLGGTELAGAQIQIFNGTQKIEEWVSGTTSHMVMLEPGQYRFHEEAAPEGFLTVTDFTFTVNADRTVTLGAIAQGETVVAENGKITVTDNAKPAPQTEPKKPTPKKPKTPNTGDVNDASQYAWLMLSSAMLVAVVGYRRKQSK